MRKNESMKKKKIKRRSKRIKNSNRKTIGEGWDTHKTTRQGVTERRDKRRAMFEIPILDTFSHDKNELEKKVKRIGGERGIKK